MVELLIGKKGTGKTKTLINNVNTAASVASGNVVFISKDSSRNMYDIKSQIRMVDTKEFEIDSWDKFLGFVCGIISGNFDITQVYIDNLYKTIGNDRAAGEAFILWAADFAAANSMEITMTVSDDPALASEAVKKYL